jgi:hypothetical protein
VQLVKEYVLEERHKNRIYDWMSKRIHQKVWAVGAKWAFCSTDRNTVWAGLVFIANVQK